MKIKGYGNTEQKVYDIALPLAENAGVVIWDINFVKEGAYKYLRVFIDKEGGISIDDCEALSRPLSKKLDELDPISESYILEVGSPGLERELLREEHFEAAIGLKVRARLIRAVDNCKEIIGSLISCDGKSIKINSDDNIYDLSLSDAAYVRIYQEYQ